MPGLMIGVLKNLHRDFAIPRRAPVAILVLAALTVILFGSLSGAAARCDSSCDQQHSLKTIRNRILLTAFLTLF